MRKRKNFQEYDHLIEDRIIKHYNYLCHKFNRHFDERQARSYLTQEHQKIGQVVLAAYHSINRDYAMMEIEKQTLSIAKEMLDVLKPKEKDL